MTTYRYLIVAAAFALVSTRVGAAQQLPGAELTQVLVTRQALLDLATRLEQTAESPSASGEQRSRARARAAQVHRRLHEGDFQVGDRILLKVDGETALSDTFTVGVGQQLVLPQIGAMSLAGVLRVELAEHVTPFIALSVRNPRVQAQALIRITILGAVGKQGFFTVPVDILVNDVLDIAGGFNATALIDKMNLQRNHEVLYDGDALQLSIVEGRTLDALGIREGDRLVVPEKAPQSQNPLQRFQAIISILLLPLTLISLINRI